MSFLCSVRVKIVSGEGKPAPGQVESKEVLKHKKNPDVGTKTTFYADEIFVEQADAASFQQDEEVRSVRPDLSFRFGSRFAAYRSAVFTRCCAITQVTLMDWGNAIVRKISRSGAADGPVESLEMELHLAGDFKKTKKKVTWIAAPSDVTPVTLLDYDYLITKKKLEEDDKVEELINPKTEFRCVLGAVIHAECSEDFATGLACADSRTCPRNVQHRRDCRPQHSFAGCRHHHPV